MSKRVRGTVARVERMGSSVYGNPYFRVGVETEDGDIQILRTKINSMINYGISKPEYTEGLWEFKLTRAGRIYAVERVRSLA